MIVQLQTSRRFVASSTHHPSCYVRARAASPPSCSVSAWPRWLGHCAVTSQLQWWHSSEYARHNVRWGQRRHGDWGWGENGEHGGSAVQRGCVSLQVNVVGSAVTNISPVLCVNCDIFQNMTSTPGLHYCLPASPVPVSKPNLVPSTLGRAEGRSAIAGKWSWVVWSAGAATATINTQSPSWMPCTPLPEHSTQVTVWKKAGFCQIFRWKM